MCIRDSLNTSEGQPLGTLCVIDNKPRKLDNQQKESLKLLAKQVVSLLELRKKNLELEKTNTKVIQLNEQLNDFAYRLAHDLKSPISGVNFLLDVLKSDHTNLFKETAAENYVNLISSRMIYMGSLVDEILEYSKINTENIVYESFNIKNILDSIITNIDFEGKIFLNSEDLDVTINLSLIHI